MPRSLPVTPRKMFPPPTTTTICTPNSRTSRICSAMRCTASGQMPTPVSPPSASPLNLTSTRENLGGLGVVMQVIVALAASGNSYQLRAESSNHSKFYHRSFPDKMHDLWFCAGTGQFDRKIPCADRPFFHPRVRFPTQPACFVIPIKAYPHGARIRAVAIARTFSIVIIERESPRSEEDTTELQ